MKKDFWKEAQTHELKNWIESSKEKKEEYNIQRSNFFNGLLKKFKMFKTGLEIGGALEPVINNLNVKEKYAIDPLIDEYKKLSKKFYAGIKTKRAVCENIPFPDSSFDLTIMLNVLDHVKSPKKSISELIRVTKKQGIILFSVDINSKLWKNIVKIRKYILGARTPNQKMHPHHLTIEEVKKLFEKETRIILEFNIENSDGSLFRAKVKHRFYMIQGKKEVFIIFQKR